MNETLIAQELLEDETLYLNLILAPDREVLISSQQVEEIISISPTQITPISQVTEPMMGIYSWRGEVLWIIDGAFLLGETAFYNRPFWSARHSVLIIQESGEHLGIMVPKVGNLERRSRFCHELEDQLNCPIVIDLVHQISQLRHQLRAAQN